MPAFAVHIAVNASAIVNDNERLLLMFQCPLHMPFAAGNRVLVLYNFGQLSSRDF